MILKLYKKYISDSTREKIYNSFIDPLKWNFRHFGSWMKGIFIFICSPFFPKNEYYNAWRYIGKHGVSNYPFHPSVNYNKMPVTVHYDKLKNLPYVIRNEKKLYFPREHSVRYIRTKYKHLSIEQDVNSSHRYLHSNDELTGKTLLDVGAAEGIFTLDTIDFIAKAYLFEFEEKWHEPLNATFEPWKEKIEIVKKYVNDFNDESNITIDSFMQEKEKNNIHLKMDIEGAEQAALKGGEKLLTNGKAISYSVCTYHKKEDADVISNFFISKGYTCEFTKGYFFMPPHMRKAVCRGNKE